ncbi:hypothetical protein [Thermoplasma sp.]|uniref:hypothetical protein n=1 Tax=Thermoplasma sp. TaxID=1973142 RepID=UPI00126B8E54|nr:hypothetical protein [Thermoplasma sp.]KAA8922000.1 MAG: hypothetical protein F6Q11_06660 [Thermoplasma sp.]
MNELTGIRKCISLPDEEMDLIRSEERLSKALEDLMDVCRRYQNALKEKAELESEYAAIRFSLFSVLEEMKRIAIQISGMIEYAKMKNIEIPDSLLRSASYITERYMITRTD